MPSFFDKLKKGMDIKNTPDFEKNSEQNPFPGVEEGIEETAPRIKKELKKPSLTFVSTSASNKKIVEKKMKKKAEKPSFAPTDAEALTGKKASEGKEKESKRKKIIRVKKEQDREEDEAPKEKKWFESEGELTVDVYQTDQEIVIQSAVAGIKPEDLDISIENDLVLIKGNRVKPFEKEKRSYFYQECYWGPFSKEIILPEEVDPSRIKAAMKQGILTIRIPKIEREKKRRVVVKE